MEREQAGVMRIGRFGRSREPYGQVVTRLSDLELANHLDGIASPMWGQHRRLTVFEAARRLRERQPNPPGSEQRKRKAVPMVNDAGAIVEVDRPADSPPTE